MAIIAGFDIKAFVRECMLTLEEVKQFDFQFFIKNNYTNWIILVFLINYYFIHCFVYPGAFAAKALHDDGFISILTLFALMFTQALVIWHLFHAKTKLAAIGFLCLVYAMQIYIFREADFHKIFTGKAVTAINMYKSAKVPLTAKVIGGAVFFPCFVIFPYLFIVHGFDMIRSFLKGKTWAVSFAIWGSLLMISQQLDKSPLNESENWRVAGIEELMEFSASIFALVSIILFSIEKYFEKAKDKLSINS